MAEVLLRLSTAAQRLGDCSKKKIYEIAREERWTIVPISPGISTVPEEQVQATIRRKIEAAEAGAVTTQREISKLGVAARKAKRETARKAAAEAEQ